MVLSSLAGKKTEWGLISLRSASVLFEIGFVGSRGWGGRLVGTRGSESCSVV